MAGSTNFSPGQIFRHTLIGGVQQSPVLGSNWTPHQDIESFTGHDFCLFLEPGQPVEISVWIPPYYYSRLLLKIKLYK